MPASEQVKARADAIALDPKASSGLRLCSRRGARILWSNVIKARSGSANAAERGQTARRQNWRSDGES